MQFFEFRIAPPGWAALQDTEPQIAPEGLAMSWWLVQSIPCLRPETAGIGSRDPLKTWHARVIVALGTIS